MNAIQALSLIGRATASWRRKLLPLVALIGGGCLPVPAQSGFPVAINTAEGYAFDLSMTAPDAGISTYVWNSYRAGAEHLFTRSLLNGKRSRIREVSPGAGTYYRPVVVAAGPDSGWVFWMHLDAGVWRIAASRWTGQIWTPAADLAEHAMLPSAAVIGGQVLLAWEDYSGPQEKIRARLWNGREWLPPFDVSGPSLPSRRLALTATSESEVWAFWDSYDGKEYGIYGRRIQPSLGSMERLSPVGKDSLNAAAAALTDGTVAVAWVSTADVTAKGVVDHWDTLRVAVRRRGRWTLPAPPGTADVADLRHSLLPRLDPKPYVLTGYYGRKRQPMLAADGNSLWLLWERKVRMDDPGSQPGNLLGSRLSGTEWSSPAVLHQGLVDYRISTEAQAKHGRIRIAGRNTENVHITFDLDLNGARQFESEPYRWTEWQPTRLPLHPAAPRSSIELDGKRYFLYWGDLHVHSRLTSDAEGEIDELMNVSRDRALLDVVAMTENANNSWMRKAADVAFADQSLTPSEYAIGLLFADRFTVPGRFIALPSWEWSQGYKDGRTNHRNVLFPASPAPLVRDNENGADFQNLCDVVETAGGIMNAHHATFDLLQRPCDANIEVASGWSVFFAKPEKIHADLSAGFKVGFVATSDGHRRNPGLGGGLTGIYAPELTRQAVIDALREHRVFATTGSRILLDARANGKFMGQDIVTNAAVNLALRVESPKPLRRAVLIRDGDPIHEEPGRSRTALAANYIDQPSAGFHWYYWRVEQEGDPPPFPGNVKVAEGNLAWTSPHRVVVRSEGGR